MQPRSTSNKNKANSRLNNNPSASGLTGNQSQASNYKKADFLLAADSEDDIDLGSDGEGDDDDFANNLYFKSKQST